MIKINSQVDVPQNLKIRPYARLLTMLGDQLIKNERIALMELIKNAYDADADWVRVVFEGFDENWNASSDAKIIIEDNGCGMTQNIIKEAWMSPAAPNKKKENAKDRITPIKKRIMQGEKGIGRFAMLKLGAKISMTTRPKTSQDEFVVVLDFSDYEDEFTKHRGKKKTPFLDELSAKMYVHPATEIVSRKVIVNGVKRDAGPTGTRIVIECLKTSWNQSKFDDVSDNAVKLQPIFSQMSGRTEHSEMNFDVAFFRGKEELPSNANECARLRELLETSSVLKIEQGLYDENKHIFEFFLNGKKMRTEFDTFREKKRCWEQFGCSSDKNLRYPECGSFRFSFYVFDLRAEQESRFYLSPENVKRIKDHRIYLYRDDIRVYPYGDPDDDWLQVDVLRGTSAASEFLSNDQVVGCIDITHEGNPALKDKTSREGLVGEGNAARDFIVTLQAFLGYVRQELFAKYRLDVQRRREQKAIDEGRVDENIAALIKHAQSTDDKKTIDLARKVQKSTQTEKRVFERRVEMTENLAAVGLAVETSSHDLMMMMGRAFISFDKLTKVAERHGESCSLCYGEMQKTRGMLSFIEHRMKDMQSLFQSAKQKPHPIQVRQILEKVVAIYNDTFSKPDIGIGLDIEETTPLTVTCTDAVLMQVFINLLDNSLHWLRTRAPKGNRLIRIVLDGDMNRLQYADSGPGIPPENRPYVFQAFFSTKDGGRGLGLYIARQLLDRLGFSIDLATTKRDILLEGANFIVDFNVKEET